MAQPVLSSLKDQVSTITLNRPEKHNCMDWEMLHLLNKHIEEAAQNGEVKAVVIRGAGDRSFSSGGDLKVFRALEGEDIESWIKLGNETFNKIEDMPKPTVAFITGYAYGGGLELALACDIRIAKATATLCCPELEHGWIPGWGAMARLRKLLGEARAKEIVFLCEVLSAEKALQLGLVSKICSEDELLPLLRGLTALDQRVFALAKSGLSYPGKGTSGSDLEFDVMATLYSKNRPEQK